MGTVNISGYTFSTCSTYQSPAMRIADTHSTVTIQLTTRPRPDDLYTQKVFTISNSDYPYLRPMVTSDSLVRYEGSVSSKSTSGYSGSTSVTSTTATSALVSASLQASVTYTARKTYNSSRTSTSGYSGVSSSSSSISTTKETIGKASYSRTFSTTSLFRQYLIQNIEGSVSTYTQVGNITKQYSSITAHSSMTASMGSFSLYIDNPSCSSIMATDGMSVTTTATVVNSRTIMMFAATCAKFSAINFLKFAISYNYPVAQELSSGGSTTGAWYGGRYSFNRPDSTRVYASLDYSSWVNSVTFGIHKNTVDPRYIYPVFAKGNTSGTSSISYNLSYVKSKLESGNLPGLAPSPGFCFPTVQSWYNTLVYGASLSAYELFVTSGFKLDAVTYGMSFTSSASTAEIPISATSTTFTNTTRNLSISTLLGSTTFTNSSSRTFYSSVRVEVHHYLSSTTALTRSSASGVTFTNSASGSTSLSETYELASNYYSNNNSSDYNVSTVTTALTSVSTVNAMTSFPSGASSTAKTVNVSAYNNNFYRSTNFKYYTNTNYSNSSVTNSNGAYTNGNMSSTTALTRASYYSTTSSTIGSMSSTTSIGSTIRV